MEPRLHEVLLPSIQPTLSRVPGAIEVQMWDEFELNQTNFDCGTDTTFGEHQRLEKAIENLALWAANEVEEQAVDEELEVTMQWKQALREDEELAEIMEQAEREDDISADWFPYPNKMMMLLDTLDNLPRIAVSDSLMQVFLWILRETGAHNVPSLDRLRKLQKKLHQECGIPTKLYQSPKKNVFYYNDPRSIIAKDWSTPSVRKEIRHYPVIPIGPISEIWHAQKWHKELDVSILSPMYDAGDGRHYYVQELAQLKNGGLVIPVRWLEMEKTREVYADAHHVEIEATGNMIVDSAQTILIKGTDLQVNFLDLQETGMIPHLQDKARNECKFEMPNSLHAMADGDPLYSSFVDYWSDDAYNKHWNCCITHCNLPRRLLQQECHIHLISTSQYATALEQFKAFKEVAESTHRDPVPVRDAKTGDNIAFQIFVNTGPGDNPSQSECSGHIGGQGNFPCHKCTVGGTDKEKESNTGYDALFQTGEARSSTETLREVQRQLDAACTGVAAHAYTQYWIEVLIEHARRMKSENRSRSAESIQTELREWVAQHQDDIINPFLMMKGFNPTRDTPIEILHTILLGIIKYIWHMSHTAWKDSQKETYMIRLQSTSIDSLSTHPIRAAYIMQYAKSLIGRQLKTLAQTTVFHTHDLVDVTHFRLWQACGKLTALLWFPEIHNMDEYLDDLKIAAGNVLDLFSIIDPTKMVQKIKLHLLSHMREDVQCLGPLLGSSTESFESYNAVFRYSSIFSNGLAPSRDIAVDLAGQESLKHRLLGGFWPSKSHGGEWVQAGPRVRDAIRNHPVLQRHLGWTEMQVFAPGTTKFAPMKRKTRERPTIKWQETKASQAVNAHAYNADQIWIPCINVIAKSQDKCVVESWVCATSPINGTLVIGRIVEILHRSVTPTAIVILDQFELSDARDAVFAMPTMHRRMGEKTYVILPASDIEFSFNAQHNCRECKCSASGERPRKQERQDTTINDRFIEHKSDDHFIINLHSLHNPHLIRRLLPRYLTAPIAVYADREQKHAEQAQGNSKQPIAPSAQTPSQAPENAQSANGPIMTPQQAQESAQLAGPSMVSQEVAGRRRKRKRNHSMSGGSNDVTAATVGMAGAAGMVGVAGMAEVAGVTEAPRVAGGPSASRVCMRK
ncbi:hypothetical protein BKA93DRAFT_817730 [Sparassis latifolia]